MLVDEGPTRVNELIALETARMLLASQDLPKAAQDYVKFIEARVGCPIAYVSVGAERDALILRG